MPVITVHNAFGLRDITFGRDYVSDLRSLHDDKSGMAEALRAATLSVKEFGDMKEGDVAIFMPDGFSSPRNLTFISVDVLFASVQRTREVRMKLAEALKAAALRCYPPHLDFYRGKYQVEVAVRAFDRESDVYI